MCAEPVRNVRSEPAGGGGIGGLSPVLKWVLGGMAVAALVVAGCCGLGMWRLGTVVEDARKEMERAQAAAEADRKARTVAVAAADLLREFQVDPAAADRKFAGKYLELTGVVERVGGDRDDTPFVILHAGDETAKVKVECFFDLADQADEARIRRLDKGQAVTVRGEYDGQVSNVQVRECELVK
jgi:hypothetical protein